MNNNKIDDKILYICKNNYNFFLQKRNVIGIGLGFKITRGFNTFKKCIKIFVVKKVKLSKLNYLDIIPKSYNGILTDVIESGIIKSSSLTKKIRPVVGGYSIGPSTIEVFGTTSCLAKDSDGYYILGSAHVLSFENILKPGEKIIQPASPDGGKVSLDLIGILSRYIPIRFKTKSKTPENYIDCALVKVIQKSSVSSKIALVGNLKGTSSVIIGETVKKVGRTTELTMGTITDIGVSSCVEFFKGHALFVDLISTTKMSQSGDSGALLIDTANNAVGILIASCDNESFFIPIDTVIKRLGINLVFKD